VNRLPPVTKLSAFLLREGDVFEISLKLFFADGGAHVDALGEAVADFESFGFGDEFLRECVGDGFFDDDAAGGRASLAGETETGADDEIDGEIEISVGENDGGIFAAHFHLGAGHTFGELFVNDVPDGIGASEGNGGDMWIAGEFGADRAAIADDDIEDAFRQPASAAALAISRVSAGACDAGLITTAFPAMSAGASFQAGIATGKFQGVIRPTTPRGSRVV
jgi:hypothetical protein